MSRPTRYTSLSQHLAYTARDLSTGIVAMVAVSGGAALILQRAAHLDLGALQIIGLITALAIVPYLFFGTVIVILTSHTLRDLYLDARETHAAPTQKRTVLSGYGTDLDRIMGRS